MSKKKQNGYTMPEAVRAILDEGRNKRGQDWVADYELNSANELWPRRLPEKKGKTVAVLPGWPPKNQENNPIREINEPFGRQAIKRWVPSYRFYIGQFVIFWMDGKTHTYQIRETEKKGVGEFVLIQVSNAEQQPGVAARTTETGGNMSSYSR